MKSIRLVALVTAFLLVLPCFALTACSKKAVSSSEDPSSKQTESSSEESSVSSALPESSPSIEEPPSKVELPDHATLYGTKHLPIPDNQGSIGSCTSEGITYTQFTVAVSQLMHHLDPDTDWDPSSGNSDYIFSPKFTYNFAGPSTEYCYSVLKDHGALPLSLSCFYKTEKPANMPYQNPSYIDRDESRSWDVSKGLMEKALKYRITDFEEVEFSSTHAGQLTTNERGLELLYKIKEAVARGNTVSICGWPYYFNQVALTEEGKGSIGIAGEWVVWTGSTNIDGSSGSGNHCVSIIGYDDELTVTVAGITFKGAFQIRDSYARDNREIYYITYDAFNEISEHKELQDPNFFLQAAALSLAGNEFEFGYVAEHNQLLSFTPTGTTITHNGKSYPTYTVSDDQTQSYLTYSQGRFAAGREGNAASFALIPCADLISGADAAYEKGVLMAYINDSGKVAGYLGTEVNANHATIRFYSDPEKDLEKVCFELSHHQNEGAFLSRLSVAKEGQGGYKRTGTIYRFSFLYWDEDIVIGTPTLMVEAKVRKVGRDNLGFVLTRTDKNGNTVEFTPACTDVPLNKGFLPELMQVGDTAFSGKSQPTKAEIGYFTFGFHVLDDFGNAASYEDFVWGIKIRGTDTEVLSLRLLNANGKELCAVTPTENDRVIEKGNPKFFEFRQAKELGSHFGSGSYLLYNVGQKKTLSLKSNNMLFEWQNEKKADSVERSVFIVNYDAQTDTYQFKHHSMDYIFDIHGSELKAGVIVKMNAPSENRPGQKWKVVQNSDGSVCIASQKDPSLYLGFDGKDFTLGTDPSNDNYRFIAKAAVQTERALDLTVTSDGFTATATLSKEQAAQEVSLVVLCEGKVITTLSGGQKETHSFTATLDKGDYLACLQVNGVIVSNRIAFRIP